MKLNSPLFPHFYESDDRPHCAGLPHTQLCGPPRTHERVVTGRSTHTYSSQQFNSWSKLTFHFTRPKARPHICGQLAHTPSAGSRSSRCGNSLKLTRHFFFKLRYGDETFARFPPSNFYYYLKKFLNLIHTRGEKNKVHEREKKQEQKIIKFFQKKIGSADISKQRSKPLIHRSVPSRIAISARGSTCGGSRGCSSWGVTPLWGSSTLWGWSIRAIGGRALGRASRWHWTAWSW